MSSTAIIFTLPSLHFPPLRFPGCPPIFITYVLCCTCLHPSVPSSPPSLHLPRCPALPSTTPTSQLDHFMPISSTALVFTLLSLHFPHLFTCLDVLHHLPPLQPLGWIISCPSPPPHSSLPFHHFISHLFACPDVPPSPTLPSTTPIPRLEHFTAVMPQLALSCNMHLVSCY